MSGPEERQRAVDLYSATPMTTAQVVEHLGHPTRQCLERWPAKDPGYAGHMAKPIILMETRAKAIEPVPGGMRQKRAAERLGAGVGTVRNRVRAYREGDMAASRRKQGHRPVRQASERSDWNKINTNKRITDYMDDYDENSEGGIESNSFCRPSWTGSKRRQSMR